jgi:hypothetical protein
MLARLYCGGPKKGPIKKAIMEQLDHESSHALGLNLRNGDFTVRWIASEFLTNSTRSPFNNFAPRAR